MNGAIVVEVRAGTAFPRGLRFSPGRCVSAFSVGLRGTWCVDAPGVTDVSMHLEFDGETVRVAAAPNADVRVDGQLIGLNPMEVTPPAVVAVGQARLLIDRDDRTSDIVACEAIVAAAPVPDAPITRVMPIETLLAERREEAAEKAFFDDGDDPSSIELLNEGANIEGAANEVRAGPGGDDVSESISGPSDSQPTWRRAKVRSAGAVLAVPLAIGAAALFIRATRPSEASAAAAPGATSVEAPRAIGEADARMASLLTESSPAANEAAPDVEHRPAAPAGMPRLAFTAARASIAAADPAYAGAPGHPAGAPPDHPSAERVAVDSVATGDYAQAARLYDELASAHAAAPSGSTFREAARILRAKVAGAAVVR